MEDDKNQDMNEVDDQETSEAENGDNNEPGSPNAAGGDVIIIK
jgi:hypothetical protein